MITIIGLDLSLTGTGFSRFEIGGNVTWQTRGTGPRPPKGSMSPEHTWDVERRAVILNHIKAWIGNQAPALVAVEKQFQGAHGGTAVELSKLAGLIEHWLFLQKFPVLHVENQQLRKFAIGSAATTKNVYGVKMKIPTKELTIASVRERWGHQVADNNEADAVVLSYIAAAVLGCCEPTTEAQREIVRTLLAKYPWIDGLK